MAVDRVVVVKGAEMAATVTAEMATVPTGTSGARGAATDRVEMANGARAAAHKIGVAGSSVTVAVMIVAGTQAVRHRTTVMRTDLISTKIGPKISPVRTMAPVITVAAVIVRLKHGKRLLEKAKLVKVHLERIRPVKVPLGNLHRVKAHRGKGVKVPVAVAAVEKDESRRLSGVLHVEQSAKK